MRLYQSLVYRPRILIGVILDVLFHVLHKCKIEYGFYKYNMSFEQFNLFLGFIYNKECDSYIDYLSMLIHYFNSSNFKNKSHDEVAHIIKEIKEKLLPIDTYSIENIISKEKNLLITLNKKGFESYKEAYNVIFYKTMQTENFSKEEKIKLFFNDNISFVLDDYENNNNISANVIKENQLYQSLLKLIKFDIDCYKIKNKKTEKTFTYEYLEKITSNLNDFILFDSTKNEYTEIIKRLLDEVLFHKQNLVKNTKSKKIPLIWFFYIIFKRKIKMDINEKNMSLKDVLLHISKLIKNNKVEKAIVFFEKNPIVNKKYMLEYIFNGSVNLNDNNQMLANINYGKLDANLMSFLLNINPDGYLSKNFFLNVILNSKNFDINLPILLIENGIDLFENYSSEINEVYSQNKNKIYFNNKVLDKYDTINLNNNSNPEITLEQIILLKLINGLFHINIDDKKKINKLFKNNFKRNDNNSKK